MLSAGIVGLPNVGKSTLFNAVTRTHKAPAENYPFCTIDPNLGIVTVPDPRLTKLAEMSKSEKATPTAIEFLDIAGLVKGASAGEGLGNQFLSHIRQVDAVVEVVRCFESRDVHHVSGEVDPIRDIEVINTELILADLASLKKRQDRLQKEVRAGNKAAKSENQLIEKVLPHLDSGRRAITADLTPEERTIARDFFLLTSKPTLFACNVGETDLAAVSKGDRSNSAFKNVELVQDYAHQHFATEAIVISAQIESELVDLSEEETLEYLRGLGIEDSGVHALIRAVYHLLGLRTFLTTGEKETRAWTIHDRRSSVTSSVELVRRATHRCFRIYICNRLVAPNRRDRFIIHSHFGYDGGYPSADLPDLSCGRLDRSALLRYRFVDRGHRVHCQFERRNHFAGS